MLIETIYGNFTLLKDYRSVFSQEDFQNRYFPEIYDKFDFIVGDVTANMLRLKGFTKKEGKANFAYIPDYLNSTCNFNTGYFILKRLDTPELSEYIKTKKSEFLASLTQKYADLLNSLPDKCTKK